MLMIGSTRLAQEVHAAWRDGMQIQGREVAAERMEWDTLSEQDKELDKYIGSRLANLLVEAFGATPGVQRLPDADASPPRGVFGQAKPG
jgi:hypothetical protein